MLTLDPLIADLIDYAEETVANCGFERDPRKFLQKLGVEFHIGPRHLAQHGGLDGQQDIVLIEEAEFESRQLFSVAHEAGHILLRRGGYLRLVKHHHVSVPNMRRHIERLADHLAGIVLMPAPLLGEARRLYGETPRAVLHLMAQTGVGDQAAMRRWSWQDHRERRAAFIADGRYIVDTTSCNARLPFQRWDRVPEPHISHPKVNLLRLGDGRRMGTVAF